MNEEDDIAAAEYVLGTLPGPEREAFARRLEGEAGLRDAVAQWEARFHPLTDAISEQQPPSAVFPAIVRTIGRGAINVGSDNVVELGRRVNRWRAASAALGLLAAGLAGIVILDHRSLPPKQEDTHYVAVVDSGGRDPALIAEVDTASGTITIRRLTAEVPSGRSLELWHIPEGENPRSLGILEAGSPTQTIHDALARGPVDGLIAVTIEPEGGSPTGTATGPVVYTGRLIPIE